MEKNVNLCDFGDILSHAETLGYSWNEAHEILDDYYPRNGMKHLYRDDIEEESNPPAKEILLSYFEKEQVKDFYIEPKSS